MSLCDLLRVDGRASLEERRPGTSSYPQQQPVLLEYCGPGSPDRAVVPWSDCLRSVFQSPVAHRSDNHLLIGVRYSRTICKRLFSLRHSALNMNTIVFRPEN